MKKHPVLALALILLLCVPVLARDDDEEQPIQLVQVGQYFVTTVKLKEGDEVRIRVKQKGDGIGDRVVLAGFTPAQVRFTFESNEGMVLEEWEKRDLEEGRVLVYEVEETTHIGVGIAGTRYNRCSAKRDGDVFEMTFSNIHYTWELEVKFVEPEF